METRTEEVTLATELATLAQAVDAEIQLRRRYARAYGNILDKELWKKDPDRSWPDADALIAAKVPLHKPAEVTEWLDVTTAFPDDVLRRHDHEKLALLVRYLDENNAEPPDGDPGGILIRVPVQGAAPSTKRFRDCTLDELRRAVSPATGTVAEPAGTPNETKRPGVFRRIGWGLAVVLAFAREHRKVIFVLIGLNFWWMAARAVRIVEGLFAEPAPVVRAVGPKPVIHPEPTHTLVTPVHHEEPVRAAEPVPDPMKQAPVEARPVPAEAKPEKPNPAKPAEKKPVTRTRQESGVSGQGSAEKETKLAQPHVAAQAPTLDARPSTPPPPTVDDRPATPPPPKAPAVAPAPEHKLAADSPKEWFVRSRGRQFGPPYLSPADVQRLCRTGQIDGDSRVWRRDTSEWTPLRAASELRDLDCPAPSVPRTGEPASPSVDTPEKLYEKASAERNENPKDAMAKLNQVLRVTPPKSEIHEKAAALLNWLEHER